MLQDLEAPLLLCGCGGLAESFRHELSLQHLEWAWRQNVPVGEPQEWQKFG